MASWNDILSECNRESSFDIVRRKYLRELREKTGRNIIIYYSGWLQKPHLANQAGVELAISDGDKNGFMATIHQLKREEGLDLLLHTPGGSMAATESLVAYLRIMFEGNIRAFVPQIAMSAGTMIACSCSQIIMGAQSSIGPIDPQYGNLPAHGLVEEFEKAAKEVKSDKSRILVWAPILQKINPTMLSECVKATAWAKEMVQEWLETGMLKDDPKRKSKAQQIIKALTDSAENKSHSRHIGFERARAIGLNIKQLEEDQGLQDAVLSVHHSCIATLQGTGAIKITENHLGIAFIQQAQQQVAIPVRV
jgi:ATP-dependent protease ClpP protease subunit